MDIRERYNLTERAGELLIYPHKPAVKTAWWVIIAIIPLSVLLFFLKELLGEVIWSSLYVIMGYGLLHSLYEILVKAKVHYRFSVRDNAVYKTTLTSREQQILQLDQVVVFTSSEMGSWRYKMGAKKRQFIKNYTISEEFGGGKKQVEYEQVVLERVYEMIAKVMN